MSDEDEMSGALNWLKRRKKQQNTAQKKVVPQASTVSWQPNDYNIKENSPDFDLRLTDYILIWFGVSRIFL